MKSVRRYKRAAKRKQLQAKQFTEAAWPGHPSAFTILVRISNFTGVNRRNKKSNIFTENKRIQ